MLSRLNCKSLGSASPSRLSEPFQRSRARDFTLVGLICGIEFRSVETRTFRRGSCTPANRILQRSDVPACHTESREPAGLGWSKNISEEIQLLPSQVLGEGTSGSVVLGIERMSKRHVAVKVLPKTGTGAVLRKNLQKIGFELEVLETLQGCPNVVDLVGKFEDAERVYIAMELCTDGDLGCLVEQHAALSESDVACFAYDMLSVLADIHSAGLAHCDVKPENFIVSTDSQGRRMLKAVDFGCAQRIRDGHRLREKTGTPLYRAPEMYSRQYGQEADLWSAGMIIYQLICGQMCFWDCLEECTLQSVMDAVLNQEVTFDCPAWKQTSPEAAELVGQLLRRNPKERISAEAALSHRWFALNCPDRQAQDQLRRGRAVGNVVPKPAGMPKLSVRPSLAQAEP
uniref:Calcium-dependent protein kinase n=1 Tax=Tetraselmis sp. GSL018 TaxID=582737 RepID=A0A061QUQ0_9CHLO